MRVAAIQLEASFDLEANRKRCRGLIQKAAQGGSKVVFLPEAAQCGFGAPGSDLTWAGETNDGPFVSLLKEVCISTKITVGAGMFQLAPTGIRMYNTYIMVGGGGVIARYRKLHLFDALGWEESSQIAPGDPLVDAGVTIEIGEFNFGLMICFDLRFPEVARGLVDQGAHILVVPAHWIAGEGKIDTWMTLRRARAIESTTYVVAPAIEGGQCCGHSSIIDPTGLVLESINRSEYEIEGENIIIADLDKERVLEARTAMPVLAGRKLPFPPTSPLEK